MGSGRNVQPLPPSLRPPASPDTFHDVGSLDGQHGSEKCRGRGTAAFSARCACPPSPRLCLGGQAVARCTASALAHRAFIRRSASSDSTRLTTATRNGLTPFEPAAGLSRASPPAGSESGNPTGSGRNLQPPRVRAPPRASNRLGQPDGWRGPAKCRVLRALAQPSYRSRRDPHAALTQPPPPGAGFPEATRLLQTESYALLRQGFGRQPSHPWSDPGPAGLGWRASRGS